MEGPRAPGINRRSRSGHRFGESPEGGPRRDHLRLGLGDHLTLRTNQVSAVACIAALQEIRVECFFPMDDPTAQIFRDWARDAAG